MSHAVESFLNVPTRLFPEVHDAAASPDQVGLQAFQDRMRDAWSACRGGPCAEGMKRTVASAVGWMGIALGAGLVPRRLDHRDARP